VIVHSSLESIRTDERSIALQHIEFFDSYATNKDIIIFDRGYPSHELIAEFEDKPWKYLMRISKGFNFIIDANVETDFIQVIRCRKHKRFVRVIKIVLPSGEIEQLITNIPQEEFTQEEFEKLYFLRWPVETKYNTIKNKLALESFSGKTVISVEQDFYATMYLANLVTFAKIESDQLIELQNGYKTRKYMYKTNEKNLIFLIKEQLIMLLLCKSSKRLNQLLDILILEASETKTQIRPDRHFPRPENYSRRGYASKSKN